MKKFLLPILLIIFLLLPTAQAQTEPECYILYLNHNYDNGHQLSITVEIKGIYFVKTTTDYNGIQTDYHEIQLFDNGTHTWKYASYVPSPYIGQSQFKITLTFQGFNIYHDKIHESQTTFHSYILQQELIDKPIQEDKPIWKDNPLNEPINPILTASIIFGIPSFFFYLMLSPPNRRRNQLKNKHFIKSFDPPKDSNSKFSTSVKDPIKTDMFTGLEESLKENLKTTRKTHKYDYIYIIPDETMKVVKQKTADQKALDSLFPLPDDPLTYHIFPLSEALFDSAEDEYKEMSTPIQDSQQALTNNELETLLYPNSYLPEPDAIQLPDLSSPKDNKDWRTCPFCGEWNDSKRKRCTHCDGRLGRPLRRDPT